MIHRLARIYRRIGIHASPPGTLFFLLHTFTRRIVLHGILRYSSGSLINVGRFGGTSYYNINQARRSRPVSGFALVFFMGVGDYLMTTPMIRALRLAHPDLPIYAYASSHADNVNSPLIVDLLERHPLIDKTFAYRGRPRAIWNHYDFGDALADIPKDFLILPVIYDVEARVYHRATSLLEAFGLPVDLPVPLPIAYLYEMSAAAASILTSIRLMTKRRLYKGIVCCHFGTRSSGYEYPEAVPLVRQLISRGFLVISFSTIDFYDSDLFVVDVTKITVTDTIELLRTLKAETVSLLLISVNSLMWPISAALGITNLGLHIFYDPSVHQYLYPNIFVLTQFVYQSVSPSRVFLAPRTAYTERDPGTGSAVTDYKSEFVIDCFETIASLLGP